MNEPTKLHAIKLDDWPEYIRKRNRETMTKQPKSDMQKFTEATAEPVRLKASFLEVFANGTFYVVGEPGEGHNCDSMGCNSFEHTIAKGRLIDWQVEEILGLPGGFLSGV
jgi:hypothetical protein